MFDRRTFLIAGAALAAACTEARGGSQNRQRPQGAAPDFAPVLTGLGAGARLGVFAIDTGSRRTVGHDEQSRYTMCSMFKAPLAGMVLAAADRGRLRLTDAVPVSQADILNNSPAVEAALPRGRMTIDELCAAAVQVSDNAAANLLLARLGGPPAFTAFVRRCGDSATRLDRIEPHLNQSAPGDERDTTTPAAMAGLMRALLAGDALRPASRARLASWMQGASTGLDRLRAGLPSDWRAGDKTGTAGNFNNDVAITWPPRRAPILIVSMIDAPAANHAARNAAHASVARLISGALA